MKFDLLTASPLSLFNPCSYSLFDAFACDFIVFLSTHFGCFTRCSIALYSAFLSFATYIAPLLSFYVVGIIYYFDHIWEVAIARALLFFLSILRDNPFFHNQNLLIQALGGRLKIVSIVHQSDLAALFLSSECGRVRVS